MPPQLPRPLGTVDGPQASPITAPNAGTRKEDKGRDEREEQQVTTSVLYSQAAEPLAALGHVCLLFTQFTSHPSAAQGLRPRVEDTGSSPGFGLNSR